MKSLLVRLAVVGMVAAVALLAIAQAQRSRLWPVDGRGRRMRRQRPTLPSPPRLRQTTAGQSASIGRSPIGQWIAAARASAPAGGGGSVLAVWFCCGEFADSACRRPRACRLCGSACLAISARARADRRCCRANAPIRAASPADDRFTAANRYPGPAAGIAATLPQQACGWRRAGAVSRRSRGCPANAHGARWPRADRLGERRRRGWDRPAGRQAA